MKRTSLGSRLVRIAARSPARSSTGPEVCLQVHAHLARDDVRERGLAQAGRAEEQHVVERFLALARGLDEDFELLADLLLAHVFGELARAQRALVAFLLRRGGCPRDQAVGFDHGCSITSWPDASGPGGWRRPARAPPAAASPPPAPPGHYSQGRAAHSARRPRARSGLRARGSGGRRQLVAQLEQQALGGLLADAGDLGEARGVLRRHGRATGRRPTARRAPRAPPSAPTPLICSSWRNAPRSAAVTKPKSRCASSRTTRWVSSCTSSPVRGRL